MYTLLSRERLSIVYVVMIAAIFYFWQLGRPDIITDESSIAVRAIGMVDFDFGIEQPTPWQWVDAVPWWMHLSFHDHPPLVFLLQHWSIRLFGETPFAVRLPSVLAGLASVLLVYLIARRLYSPAVGLAASALFAFTVNHVWISRIGLQESIAIALILASSYFFLRALGPGTPVVSMGQSIDTDNNAASAWPETGDRRWFIAAGAFLGLAFLAKYHALILTPIFLTLVIFHRNSAYTYDRGYKRNWKYFFAVVVLFVGIVSPVVVYNLQLYRNFGHFDFQFSQFFGQEVEAWPSHPGQEVLGSYGERIRTYLPRLIESNSPYFLILSAIGLITVLWQLTRRSKSFVIGHSSLVIVLAWLLPFLVFIGPAHRFLALLTPWLAIAAGYAIVCLFDRLRRPAFRNIAVAAVVVFVAFEGWYSHASVVALDPVGPQPWAHSYLRRQAGNWGFNELSRFLDAELAGKMPDPAITFEFPFAKKILNRSAEEARLAGREPVSVGIVYNDNINLSSQLWVFLRRITYHGWPVVSAENFRRGGAADFFRQSGVKRIYFINPTLSALQDRTLPPTPDGDLLEAELKAKGLTPKEIKKARGEVAFRVYRFGF